ncbi:MAG: J domain-containing protein [Kofleriaceae bacterium]
MAAGRTLHVRCTTWEQVEVFYTRKLRRGKLLSMKVPFPTEVGAQVTLGLELPNQVVIAIDGKVHKASPIEGDTKIWIEVELVGFTDEVLARIKQLAAGYEPPPVVKPDVAPDLRPDLRPNQPPAVDELPSDERALFQHLTGELRRLRQLAVHEVLDVERDADAEAVRHGWMMLVRKLHPDLVARHHAPAITHLAEELTILANRAYDRLRTALVAEGRATTVGSVLRQPAGWLVGFEDISSKGVTTDHVARRANSGVAPSAELVRPKPRSSTSTGPGQGDEEFEERARAMLGDGDAPNAQEVLAAALCVYPRSRPLRSLYYVASAMAALEKGELMLATSQLETALAHHEQCIEAAQILEHVKQHGGGLPEEVRRLFR